MGKPRFSRRSIRGNDGHECCPSSTTSPTTSALFISQGLGHQSYSPMSDQAIRNALEKTWSPRERVKMYALGCTGHRASRHLEGQGRAGMAEGCRTVVDGAAARDHVVRQARDLWFDR
jgi:hypothetical protein